jgi:hypothetical protein
LLLSVTFNLVKYLRTRVEPLMRLHSEGRLQALPVNIKLGWKQLMVKNTLSYHEKV